MKLVIIESPLGAATRAEIEGNKTYARACLRDALLRGEAPFASHLLYDQPGVLDDLDPAERERGLQAGFAWGRYADAVIVYTDRGISNGMQRGIDLAAARGLVVEYRSLQP
jgi:hypothetical protein